MPDPLTNPLLDSLPCGFIELDGEDRVVQWNQRLERWTGQSGAAVAGRKLGEVFPGNPAIGPLLAEVRASRRPRVLAQMFHHRLIPIPLPTGHLSGLAEMQQECHLVPLETPAGHLALSILDVTPLVVGQQRSQALVAERNRAEEAVQRRASFLEALNQTTLEMMGRRNVNELLQDLAHRCSTLLDCPHAEIALLEGDELVVRAVSSGTGPLLGDRAGRDAAVLGWQACDSRVPVVVACYADHPARRPVYQPYHLQAVADIPIIRGPECLGVLGLARTQPDQPFTDEEIQHGVLLARMAALVLHNAITYEDAVRATEVRTAALRESEERFRILAEVAPVGIFGSDAAGQLTLVNRRWCEISGLPAAAALGRGWFTAIHPEDRDRVIAAWQHAVQSGEASLLEYRFLRPDGTIRWLVGQSQLQARPDGTRAGFVGTITDITSLQHAEEERKQVEAHLRQVQKMESIGTLAGGIAHDFNNILTGTFAFVDLARLELPESHPVQAWLNRISASSQRARELVRQILTFSRKQEGKRTPQRLHVPVNAALRLLRTTLPPAVILESQVTTDAPAALADATQIHQVVLNLCTNAWHALPPRGGRITVSLEAWTVNEAQAATHPDLPAGPYVRLTVADDGSGMDAATLEQIFDPFFTTKDTGSGTGLGLAVVHGIIQLHQGAIAVRSTPGAGTTFELFFPAVAGKVESKPASRQITRGSGERVLLVDDDAVSGFAIEKLIETLNYSVRRFSRPEDALASFAGEPEVWDLVVSDLAMPGMNGDELVERMLRIRPDLPVIIVTGYVATARQELLEKTSARAVLHKPVVRQELAAALAEHVRRAPPPAQAP